MATSSQSPTSGQTKPGAPPSPDFSSNNVVLDWIRSNTLFLGLLAAAVVVIFVVRTWLPRLAEKQRIQSWELHQEAMMALASPLEWNNVQAALEKTRDDDRVHPFFVAHIVQQAFQTGNRDILEGIQGEVQELASDGALEGYSLYKDGQVVDLMPYLNEKLKEELDGESDISFSNPEPKGNRVKFSISVSEEESYDIVFGLYSDIAPESTQTLLTAVEEGYFVGQEVTFQGQVLLRMTGMAKPEDSEEESGSEEESPKDPEGPTEEDEPSGLPLEAQWGYFHFEGALCTMTLPGAQGGVQDPNVLTVLLQDSLGYDGSTTVLGKIVEGAENMEILQDYAPTVGSETEATKLTIKAVELLQ